MRTSLSGMLPKLPRFSPMTEREIRMGVTCGVKCYNARCVCQSVFEILRLGSH